MFGCDKGKERLVQLTCLHLRLLAPTAFVRKQGISELVGPKVHIGLMVVVLAGRRSQESEAKRPVGGFVPSVLAVTQDSHAVAVCLAAVVGPLVAADLVFVLGTNTARDGAKGNIVGVIVIGEREGEIDLQHALVCLPINFVDAFHAVVEGIHTDILHKGGTFLLTRDSQGFTQRAVLDKLYLRIARDVGRRSAADIGITDLPSRPRVLVVVDELLPHRGIDEIAAVPQVI